MNFFDLDDRVTAAAVAATGTVVAALIQLRIAWRKEMSERARGVPVTKKARRGPIFAVVLLLVAAAVGGFALSQFFVASSVHESAALQGQMQTELAQISATAARLEQASRGLPPAGAPIDHAAEARPNTGEVVATASLGACRARAGDSAGACTAQDAAQLTLCASLPLGATVVSTQVFTRPEDASRPWTEAPATPGEDLGRVRFAPQVFERPDAAQTRQLCTTFSSWDSEHPVSARLVVRFGLAPAPALGVSARAEAPRYARSTTGEDRP